MVDQTSFLPETDWAALTIAYRDNKKMWGGRIIDAETTDTFLRGLNFIKPEKNFNA
jgi:hypothetical protein